MILYHSTLCRPCRMMDALVQMVRRDYEPQVTFVDVITDQESNRDLVEVAQIHTIPTAVFLSAAGDSKVVAGLMTQQALRAELAALMGAR